MLGFCVPNRRGMSGTYSNAPCTEEGYKFFPLHKQFLRNF
jgi:hypothetical protein